MGQFSETSPTIRKEAAIASVNPPRIVDASCVLTIILLLSSVMGGTGSGKTTFINLLSGSELRVGWGLKSCTSTVQVSKPFELDDYVVTLIDTPGFDDTTRSDADILNMIATFFATAYEAGHLFSGIIYMHPISNVRMGGVSTLNFRLFQKLCGESAFGNVAIVTTMWGRVTESEGQAREKELSSEDLFFKPVLEMGGQMLRHDATLESAQAIMHAMIRNKPRPMKIQRELHDDKLDILQTSAGEELNRQLKEQAEMHREQLRALEKELREAILAKDEETKADLEEARMKLQADMARVQSDASKLASEYKDDKEQLERMLKDVEKKARQESELREEESQRRLRELQFSMKRAEDDTAYDIARMRQELFLLQSQSQGADCQPSGIGFFSLLGSALDIFLASQLALL
ncbi:hypothetical protein BD410DRAFT_720398 [Rickenella mellea]|uniref:G domain-containing protein n=1 Tax=Rickenella mellea TaxID=50990 RepID=A0A4Y7Q9W9_9AGAM|nr:hypothetical protein BD410DRAFT_720398 [Rickenella mellea]